MDRFSRQDAAQRPMEVGPVRWTITAFGGCVFAVLVLMAGFNLSKWAVHRLDQFVVSKAFIDERTP